MTPRSARLVLVMLVGLVAAGLVTKGLRYRERFSGDTKSAEAQVGALFAQSGWRHKSDLKPAATDPYPWLVFEKTGCTTPAIVSLLNANGELRRLVDLYHMGDLVYVQNGHVVEKPSAFSRYKILLADSLSLEATPAAKKNLPLLAISPASVATDPACRLPFEKTR